jgi:hypothetical protein
MERKPNAALMLSALTPQIYIGYLVFAEFALASILEAHDRPFYRHIVLTRVSDFAAASAHRLFKVHHLGARSGDLSVGFPQIEIEELRSSTRAS